jgi:HEAT repeat protein
MSDMGESCRQGTEEARRDSRSTQELIALALAANDEDEAGSKWWEVVHLLHFRATREVFEAAKGLCGSASAVERRLGADVLAQIGVPERAFPREALAILAAMVAGESAPDVLYSVTCAIAHQRLDDVVPVLLRLKSHPSSHVRRAVASSLGGWDTPEAIGGLTELSMDEDEAVRDWATCGLGTMTDLDSPDLRAALAARLDDPDPVTRAEAMVGLARRKDERVLEALLAILHPDHIAPFELRSDLVLEAVEEFPSPLLLPGLLRLRGHLRGQAAEWLEELIAACKSAQEHDAMLERTASGRIQ